MGTHRIWIGKEFLPKSFDSANFFLLTPNRFYASVCALVFRLQDGTRMIKIFFFGGYLVWVQMAQKMLHQ